MMQEKEQRAKDMAVKYGLQSKEYADAVKDMNAYWLSMPKSKVYNFINNQLQKLWKKNISSL